VNSSTNWTCGKLGQLIRSEEWQIVLKVSKREPVKLIPPR
jgi:hypothetical protein